MATQPSDQKCHLAIAPSITCFAPNALDVWTQFDNITSYFVYGSSGGCFNYGQISHNQTKLSALVNQSIQIKEDNSRVICVRFLKPCPLPLVMVLTLDGSLIIHNCMIRKTLIHYKKFELVKLLLEPIIGIVDIDVEPQKKKVKSNSFHQITSCSWPDYNHLFMSVILVKEKKNLLLWLKLSNFSDSMQKADFIKSDEKLNLGSPESSSPICCMESIMVDKQNCLIATAQEDGMITVINVILAIGQSDRVIRLNGHCDKICSMSFYMENKGTKFPSGILASVSRDGRTLIWDIERGIDFAEYQASPRDIENELNSGKSSFKINWFALSFIQSTLNSNQPTLIISNQDSALTILKRPENHLRPDENSSNQYRNSRGNNRSAEQTIRHHSLIFNIAVDTRSNTLVTSSLDGSLIFWSIEEGKKSNESENKVELRPKFLYPSMSNNSRSHMLRFNLINEGLMAMALGKGGLRFCKMSANPMNSRFDMTPSCALVARKISKSNLTPTSIAWHPSHEYRLSIGTLEGKVLRIDLTPGKSKFVIASHKPILGRETNNGQTNYNGDNNEKNSELDELFDVEFQPLQRAGQETRSEKDESNKIETDGVYSVCWGPNPNCSRDLSRLAIYAVGSISKRLFIYCSKKEGSDKLTNFLDEFDDHSLPEANGKVSEVCWKSSLEFFALGTIHGDILIMGFNTDPNSSQKNLFRRIALITGSLGDSYIQCLAWHPTSNKRDRNFYSLLAAANESPAFLFNIKDDLFVKDIETMLNIEEDSSKPNTNIDMEAAETYGCSQTDDSTIVIKEYTLKFDTHKKAITDIAWNPHKSNEFATCSFDKKCHVWFITSEKVNMKPQGAKIKSSFQAKDRLFTLEWSYVDRDLIYTSGQDSTVWAWRPSENMVCEESELVEQV